MFKNTNVRFIVIALAVVLAGWSLNYTVRYNTMSDEKMESMRMNGTLKNIQDRILQLGLDLQGGMHVVMELDLPKLMENMATNTTTEYEEVLEEAVAEYNDTDADFFRIFAGKVAEKDLKLVRFYPNMTDDNGKTLTTNDEIVQQLRVVGKDAVTRAMAIIRNRVDQFGVSEPTIQKVGNFRIIVELAGIQDPERARNLIQSTALLEFVLLKDATVTQSFIRSVDNFLKTGKEEAIEIDLAKEDTLVDQKTLQEETMSVNDLLGDAITDEAGAVADSSDSTVVVDKDLAADKPFTSLLVGVNGQIGVPKENVYAVKKILAKEEVKKLLPFDSKILWSAKTERYMSNDGKEKEAYQLFLTNKDADLKGEYVTKAQETIGGTGTSAAGQSIVNLSMNNEGSKKFSRLTGSNIDKFLAIVLDDKVHMAPRIKVKIPNGSAYIEGFASMQEAKDIAIVLRAGALPAKVNIIEERTVGPTLGRDSISLATKLGIIGFVLIIAFMVVYYKGAGLIADLALLLNLIFVLAILAMLQATLTLPGLAGLILTIGIAVDNNVLIFERIREELDKGKTVKASIDSGYSLAFKAIADANITTIFSALILMTYGTGPIRGFGVTLFWGVVSSFFTAIFVTRTIFHFRTDRKVLEKLSI